MILIFKCFCSYFQSIYAFSKRNIILSILQIFSPKLHSKFLALIISSILFVQFSYSQINRRDSLMQNQHSYNGFILPVNGHIHILIIYAEVIYDVGNDPTSIEGSAEWPSGQLPVWRNQLLSAFPTANPQELISRYYHEASFGELIITGDYLINPENPQQPIQIKASEGVSARNILKKASELGVFTTQNGFLVTDFDKWTLSHVGHPKHTPSFDNPPRIDHLMIITRNTNSPSHLSGWTSSQSPGVLFSYQFDTYSFFCTQNLMPTHIMLHEFNHLLMGGNNFHAGGGHSKLVGNSYFPSLQGGWGMMGAAGKSLLTWNAWDQNRLGWKHHTKNYQISTLDSLAKNERFADLDTYNKSHEGVYLIRDFVITGDAIRIKLPYLPENEFQQWLWIENHQTKTFNNSPFDRFQYEHEDCIDAAVPGLYMYIQVDKEEKQGREIFGGHADYLRPLPANGLYDINFENYKVQNPWCINNLFYFPHSLRAKFQNPLSGNHELETVLIDQNGDGKIEIKEQIAPAVRKENSEYRFILPNLGRPENAFTLKNNRRIAIDANPSTASNLTNVSAINELYRDNAPNNRKVFLNGISVEILDIESTVPGAIYVKIKFDDYNIRNNVRWCADTIVLSQHKDKQTKTLYVHQKKQLLIDVSRTANRLIHVDSLNNQPIFNKKTVFILEPNTQLHLKRNSRLILDNESQLIIMPGAKIIKEKKAKIKLKNNSRIIDLN